MTRLIDADALMAHEFKNDISYKAFCNLVKRQPAADVAPVRHGKWITYDEFIDCSLCLHEKWSRVPYEELVRRFRYCPHCGSKMDLEG